MASGGSRGRLWRPGGGPLPAREVAGVVGDTTVAPRIDGPRHLGRTTGSSSGRSVTGEGMKWSDIVKLEFVVCFRPLWEAAEASERHIKKEKDQQNPAGRKRLHGISEALLFVITAKIFGGYRAADKILGDTEIWERLARAVARAYPNDPDRRLPLEPIERHHFGYMRDLFICGKVNDEGGGSIEELAEHLLKAAFEAAVDTDMLDPDPGTVTHLDASQVAAGDGTWIRARYQASERDCAEAAREGQKLRCDPDAVAYRDKDSPDRSRGFTAVFGSCRNAHRQERITLFADIKPKGMTDATFFRYMMLQAKQEHPELTKGLKGIAYDMAVSSADMDAFLRAGIIPISKVPRISGGHPSMSNLGKHKFKLRAGNRISETVVAVDGPPTIEAIDSNGDAQTVPLTRTKTIKRGDPRRYRWYNDYEVPDYPVVPLDLVGATTTIRQDSTTDEIEVEPHQRRTRSLRVISEADEDFDRLYGLREDTESNNSQYKQTLHLRRARTVGANNLRLDLLAYQCDTIITTLVAHHLRTGSSLKGWFGDCPPPYRRKHTG